MTYSKKVFRRAGSYAENSVAVAAARHQECPTGPTLDTVCYKRHSKKQHRGTSSDEVMRTINRGEGTADDQPRRNSTINAHDQPRTRTTTSDEVILDTLIFSVKVREDQMNTETAQF